MSIALVADGAATAGIYPLRLVGLCVQLRRLLVKNTHRCIRRISIALIADGADTTSIPVKVDGPMCQITSVVDGKYTSVPPPFCFAIDDQVMDEDDNSKKLLLDEHQVSLL